MKFNDFAEIGINQSILDATLAMGFDTPTPVQEQTIPLAITGADLLVQAPTGTGKTAAFGIPMLSMIDLNEKSIQAVILCPTRELTMQIAEELKKLSAKMQDMRIATIYGGQNIERQLSAIRKKPHIIVGTTGRVMDHMRRNTLKLHDAKMIILDEADEMLSMGFRDDIDFILKSMMRDVQKLFFSATVPSEILGLSATYQKSPINIKTTCDGMDLPSIKQFAFVVKEDNKYELMKKLITDNNYKNILVFCNTKIKVDQLNDKLNEDFYLTSLALHGDLRQRDRDRVMKCFRNHQANMLIATDVCARGIDVDGIEAIFNFDIPLDEEYYVHRIGRTARANRSGIAYSFMTAREKNRLIACEKAAGARMEVMEVDGLTEHSKLGEGRGYGCPTTRFFVNIGMKDDASAEKIVAYITGKTHITDDDIYDIKLKDIFGFIEVDSKFTDEMLSLDGSNYNRRRFAVEICTERGGSGKAPIKKVGVRADGSQADERNRGERKPYGGREFGGNSVGKQSNNRKPYGERGADNRRPYAERGADNRRPSDDKSFGLRGEEGAAAVVSNENKPNSAREGRSNNYRDSKPNSFRDGNSSGYRGGRQGGQRDDKFGTVRGNDEAVPVRSDDARPSNNENRPVRSEARPVRDDNRPARGDGERTRAFHENETRAGSYTENSVPKRTQKFPENKPKSNEIPVEFTPKRSAKPFASRDNSAGGGNAPFAGSSPKKAFHYADDDRRKPFSGRRTNNK